MYELFKRYLATETRLAELKLANASYEAEKKELERTLRTLRESIVTEPGEQTYTWKNISGTARGVWIPEHMTAGSIRRTVKVWLNND